MELDSKMVRKGSDVPLGGLVDQGGQARLLTAEFGAELAKFGYGPAQAEAVLEQLKILGSEKAQVIDARAQAKSSTQTERQKLSEAKRVKRVLVSAVTDLFADGEISVADRDAFHAGAKLGRSTPDHSVYLGQIRGVVDRLAPKLRPLIGDVDPLALVDGAKSSLDGAQATQEFSLQALPQETAEVYEAKGRLLSLIEKQNRAAARAFDGNALVLARFNKDQILRAVQARKKETEPTT